MFSKSITTYFITMQLLLGFDFGFFSLFSKGTRALAKFVSTIAALSIVSMVFICMYKCNTTVLHTTQYVTLFLILKCSKYSVYHFLKDLRAVDAKQQMKLIDNYVGLIICLYTLFVYLIKLSIAIIDCTLYSDNLISTAVFLLPILQLITFDVMPVVTALIYYNIYIRINILRKGFISSRYPVTVANAIFKDIADCFDKIRLKHDHLVIAAFVFNFMQIMTSIYIDISSINMMKNPDWSIRILDSIYPVHLVLQIIFPTVLAEMIGVETDAMKMILHERLLVQQDVDETQRSLCFLRYLEGRRLLRKAWRLVPVDLQLPISLLSMSASYTIVMIQFTHLID